MKRIRIFLILSCCFCIFQKIPGAEGQQFAPAFYDVGSPQTADLWVDPVGGNDGRSGATRDQALRTLDAAWRRIPQSTTLTQGYRLRLTPGEFLPGALPNYWESRWGTFLAPIIIEAADGPGTVFLRNGPNVFDSRYVYFVNLSIVPNPAGDAFHCEKCDHILLRGNTINGGLAREAQETIKVNQSQYIYIEGNDISGAHDNAIDFVSVQYGHVIGNRIHNAEDWCIYSKGGSSYLRIEGNNIFDCGTGGYTAGQGSGFEFIDSPWLHYEAYNIKVVNNIIHDTEGAGLGVNGGYNILMAYNTMYRVGRRSHGIEVVFGERSCDGMTAQCAARVAAGGWGPSTTDISVPIPNRNVFIYNNLLLNPPGVQSTWQHFAIYGPRNAQPGSNVPSPARTDTDLQIHGNVIWNGPADLSLGLGEDSGCLPSNPTCNAEQLLRDNRINTVQPDLVDPGQGNYLPGPVTAAQAGSIIPAFPGGDEEQHPHAPQGNLANDVPRDYYGNARNPAAPAVGALLPGSTPGAGLPGLPLPPSSPSSPTPPSGPQGPSAPSPDPGNPPGPGQDDPGPQFLGMTVNRTLFPSRGGPVRINVFTARTTKATVFLYNLRTRRMRAYTLRGAAPARDGTRRYSASLVVAGNSRAIPEQYEVLVRLINRYGDRTVDYGAITVNPRIRRR